MVAQHPIDARGFVVTANYKSNCPDLAEQRAEARRQIVEADADPVIEQFVDIFVEYDTIEVPVSEQEDKEHDCDPTLSITGGAASDSMSRNELSDSSSESAESSSDDSNSTDTSDDSEEESGTEG